MIQKVVGMSFRPTSDPAAKVGATVKLVHEADNRFSVRAVAIMLGDTHLGYLAESGNTSHAEVFERLPLEAKLLRVNRLLPGEVFGEFKEGEITSMDIDVPMPSDDGKKIKSFNEDIELMFMKNEHRYLYDSKELISGTRYIKRWIKDFDKEAIAPACARKYGCQVEDVINYWASGGDVSAVFGTSIHNALEHYGKWKWLGEIIQGQKGLEFNPALPTHPVLRRIVEEFHRLPLQSGEVIFEALLTNVERGLCGFADRVLITGEKKCRVQDYKVNVGAEAIDPNTKYLGVMADLPKNKLSKYQLQMSFYARLLELSGWEVEGLDVFVFEDIWKHFAMPVLKLDF